MFTSLRKRLFKRRSEKGSDVVQTLFMLPFAIGLIFAGIDVGTYFQTKTQVQNITRDGARQISLYGGWSPTISLNREQLGGKKISEVVYNRLVDGDGNCRVSGCSSRPTVTCGPEKAHHINEDAYCRVTYHYRGIGGGIVEWLGFNSITDSVIKAEESFKVETTW